MGMKNITVGTNCMYTCDRCSVFVKHFIDERKMVLYRYGIDVKEIVIEPASEDEPGYVIVIITKCSSFCAIIFEPISDICVDEIVRSF